MAAIHLFGRVGPDRNKVIIHVVVPGGNNAVGVSWADVLENVGISHQTSLRVAEGDPGIGEISAAEKALIDIGDLMEIPGVIKLDDDTDEAGLTILATRMYTCWESKMAEKYNYYGFTHTPE